MTDPAGTDHVRLWLREPLGAEVVSGITAVCWSTIALVLGGRAIEPTSLRVLATLMQWEILAAVGLAIGCWQLAALIVDHRWLRWWACIAAVGWWTMLFAGVAQTAFSPSLALYGAFAGLNTIPALRLLKTRPP